MPRSTTRYKGPERRFEPGSFVVSHHVQNVGRGNEGHVSEFKKISFRSASGKTGISLRAADLVAFKQFLQSHGFLLAMKGPLKGHVVHSSGRPLSAEELFALVQKVRIFNERGYGKKPQ